MLFQQSNNFIILTQHFKSGEHDKAIATSNVLLYLAARLKRPIIHLWTLENTVILGHMDAKLKSLAKGLKVLKENGYDYIVRNAGGLGVVSDNGILNLSFYFPDQMDVPINDAYDETTNFVQTILNPYGVQVESGEIYDSYCPGNYDLSINSKKFSGQAQRRAKNGVAILLYLSLNGDQKKRGQMMHNFYEQANVPKHEKLHFPDVNPASMVNLVDTLSIDLTENDLLSLVKSELLSSRQNFTEASLQEIIDPEFEAEFNHDLKLLHKRMDGLNNA